MSPEQRKRRAAAVKIADTINNIEGVPASEFARDLSEKWIRGEISGSEMKNAIIASHRKAL